MNKALFVQYETQIGAKTEWIPFSDKVFDNLEDGVKYLDSIIKNIKWDGNEGERDYGELNSKETMTIIRFKFIEIPYFLSIT